MISNPIVVIVTTILTALSSSGLVAAFFARRNKIERAEDLKKLQADRDKLQADPADYEAHDKLARAYYYGGDHATAIMEWRKASEVRQDFGMRLRAFVVVSGSVTEDELKEHVKQNLARFKVPREIVIMDELPRNATGKVLKRELDAD